jgi:hypothetical protein
MPIRLNLLAEARAAEEMRRQDPVKRVIWLAALLVTAMLAWSSLLQLRAMIARGDLTKMEVSVASNTNEYQSVIENQKKSTETLQKLAALHQLATNRFLNGTLLNALQQATVADVQLVHLKVDQKYAAIEETKARTNGNRVVPGRPAGVTERIVLTLEARDQSANPGDQVNKFREMVSTNSFFLRALGKTNEARLDKLNPPQSVPGEPAFVSFAVECRFQEKTR